MNEYGLHYLLNSSDIDLESFTYMEIGKIHKDSLNWERRRRDSGVIGLSEIPPLNNRLEAKANVKEVA